MTRMDPRGVRVAELNEVFGGDEIQDLFAGIAEANRHDEERMKEDTNGLHNKLAKYFDPEVGWDQHVTVLAVHEVLDASISGTFSGGETTITADASLCIDGVVRRGIVELLAWSTPGDFYEPPDGGEEVRFTDRKGTIEFR